MNIEPLDRFPFIRTTDVDEMREAIAKTHGDNKLQLHRGAEGFHACGNRRVLRNIVLSYASFGAVVDQEFSAFTGFAQQFRIRGELRDPCRSRVSPIGPLSVAYYIARSDNESDPQS